MDKVLVATVTNTVCSYALDRWVEAYRRFTYPHRSALIVTDDIEFYRRVRFDDIRVAYVEPDSYVVKPSFAKDRVWSICNCREALKHIFIDEYPDYEFLLTVDADVELLLPDSIERMLRINNGEFDVIRFFTAMKPPVSTPGNVVLDDFGMDCILWRRKAIASITFTCCERPDGGVICEGGLVWTMFDWWSRLGRPFKVVTRQKIPLRHYHFPRRNWIEPGYFEVK